MSNNIELAKSGYANGISTQLAAKYKLSSQTGLHEAKLSDNEKISIIDEAALYYGKFLNALGVDWQNDPNSSDTPRRVAKAYVNDLWAGRYNPAPNITAFPNDGYTGIVQESNIPVISMCSHHHETIMGTVNIAYIPSESGKVVGLSKLNRIVEHFSRRGSIQEQLTVAIHNAIDIICEGNKGVAVMINATHNCVQCRGVKHIGASMQTTKLSGAFDTDPSSRAEFYKNIELASSNR